MKRKIITIDEDLCNGCGSCITACAEGALQLVDGKARLVKAQFCDGFGDCMGDCPTGALKIEEREADEFDVQATKNYLRETQGDAAVRRMEEAAKVHEAKAQGAASGPRPPSGGCPGTRMRTAAPEAPVATPVDVADGPAQAILSDLQQWPVQLHLVQPGAPFFKGKELVVLSTCSPVASADVHWRFMRGRSLVVACPKLDRTEGYVDKLAAILSDPSIPRAIVVRMEVPCCGGLTAMARQAVAQSGRSDLKLDEVTIGLGGEIKGTVRLA